MTRCSFLALLGVLVLAPAAACGGDDGPAPHIDQLAPAEAAVGGTVDVLGARFCGPTAADVGAEDVCAAPPAGFVTFGTAEGVDMDAGGAFARGQIIAWKGTRITVTVPQLDPGVTSVVVTVNGLQSNARDFTILQ